MKDLLPYSSKFWSRSGCFLTEYVCIFQYLLRRSAFIFLHKIKNTWQFMTSINICSDMLRLRRKYFLIRKDQNGTHNVFQSTPAGKKRNTRCLWYSYIRSDPSSMRGLFKTSKHLYVLNFQLHCNTYNCSLLLIFCCWQGLFYVFFWNFIT